MANPKKKHTRMRTSSRRASNWKLEVINLSRCSQCGAAKPSHYVCPACGFYRGQLMRAPRLKKAKDEGESPKG